MSMMRRYRLCLLKSIPFFLPIRISILNCQEKCLYQCHGAIQNKLHKIEGVWLSAKAEEQEEDAVRNNFKWLYEAPNPLYRSVSLGIFPILNISHYRKGSDPAEMTGWFEAILNQPSSINNKVIDKIPQVDFNSTMDDSLG